MSAGSDEVQRARQAAEGAREQHWRGESFLKELFLGRLRPELLDAPTSTERGMDRNEFVRFHRRLERFLRVEIDPDEIDARGEYPRRAIERLTQLGAFGMKIDPAYGGLGLSHAQYVHVMQMVGARDANIAALLSAHQAIGVPHPVAMFGSEELKARYLPRCAAGAISGFALTEPAVGSDPARLQTVARPSTDGRHVILDGIKLWCTNGTLAEVIVVLARNPETDRIGCFVVEMDWDGVHVERRCHFMGLRALGNALIRLEGVRVPRENVVGEEGDGLRIALATLNTGRLTLPAATAGAAKTALQVCRRWASAREQWGQAIGKHEAIAHRLAAMAYTTYAMESVAETVGALADRHDRDIRLEAAAAKEWNTDRGWALTDSALQIRGGRGYETAHSLAARGEPPVGIERMLRDSRINRIFEGSSEIMHLFIAREALDHHLQVAGALVDDGSSALQKAAALPRVLAFYGTWYPRLWLAGLWTWTRYRRFGALAPHFRFAERAARRLARSLFHAMVAHGPALEKKQATLFRAVDIGLELFALVATLTRAHAEHDDGRAGDLANAFSRAVRRKVARIVRELRHNDDALDSELGREVLAERHAWLERHVIDIGYGPEQLRPASVEELRSRGIAAGRAS